MSTILTIIQILQRLKKYLMILLYNFNKDKNYQNGSFATLLHRHMRHFLPTQKNVTSL